MVLGDGFPLPAQVEASSSFRVAAWPTTVLIAVRLRAGKGSDIAVALPDGWVVGTSQDVHRWGHHVTAAEGWRLALAALDLDGDGAQELIIASGKTVSAWTWNGATRARP